MQIKQQLITPSGRVTHRWPVGLDPEDRTEFEGEKEYDTLDAYIRPFSDAWVSPDSVVYHRALLVPETVVMPGLVPYYRYRHAVKKYFFSKRIRLNASSRYLLTTNAWSTGHFHWNCEVLPSLWSIRDRAGEYTLLLPDQPYTRTIGLESIALLGLKFRDIIFMDPGSFYKVKELDLLTPFAPSGHMHPGLLQSVRAKLLEGRQSGKKRIYISRSKAKYRKVVNEDELIGVLKGKGFEVLRGEDLSLADQISVFSQTEILAGIHGAGLANALFMHPGSSLLELRRKEHGTSNVGFWHLADALDIQFSYYNAKPDSGLPLVGQGCNLIVDVKEFSSKVLSRF